MHESFGDVVRLRPVGPLRIYLCFHPTHVEHVLQGNHKNYRKGRFNMRLRIIDGDGLLTSEGETWLRQRRMMQPAFHRQAMAGLFSQMVEVVERAAARWEDAVRTRKPVDLMPDQMEIALSVALRTLFSTSLPADLGMVRGCVDVAREHVTWRMYHVMSPPEFVPTPRNVRFLCAKGSLDRFVYRIIAERRAH